MRNANFVIIVKEITWQQYHKDDNMDQENKTFKHFQTYYESYLVNEWNKKENNKHVLIKWNFVFDIDHVHFWQLLD